MRLRTRTPRRHLVVIGLIVTAALASTTTAFAAKRFSDVPNSNPFKEDITWMSTMGISEGYPDGTFRPGEPVTRQAMSAFMHRLYDEVAPQQLDRSFHVFVACAGTTRLAVIARNGSVVRASAGTTATKLGTGTYRVLFDVNVDACSWQVTVGTTLNSGVETGVANVAGLNGNAKGLYITTYDVPNNPIFAPPQN